MKLPGVSFNNGLKMRGFLSKFAGAALGLVLLAGCQSADYRTSKVKTPTRVVILFSRPTRAYTIIGSVATLRPHEDPRLGWDSSRTWQDELQRQAGAQDADAVIVNTASLNNINANLITGSSIRYGTNSVDGK
jgi:hypothetical protein